MGTHRARTLLRWLKTCPCWCLLLGYHHPYAVPTAHHVLPAVSYSGCRNVHGALVPCAFPIPFLTAVEAPAVIETVAVAPVEEAAAPEAAVEEAAAPEAAVEEAAAPETAAAA